MVFCKYPEPGAVKTRLARGLGAQKACALYRAFVRDVLEALENAGAEIRLFADPNRRLDEYLAWLEKKYEIRRQRGQDLGQRMANAFAQTFREGRGRALLVGTDIPQLPPWYARAAWRELEDKDMVLGPALDGGYYLMGLRRQAFDPGLFRGVSWSTRHVLRQTLDRLRRGRRHVLLPRLRDCDTSEDLYELLRQAPLERARATRRQARALKLL